MRLSFETGNLNKTENKLLAFKTIIISQQASKWYLKCLKVLAESRKLEKVPFSSKIILKGSRKIYKVSHISKKF
jgi:hypothetical protein